MRRVVPECQSHNQMSPNRAHAHRGMLVRNTERPEYIMYEANELRGFVRVPTCHSTNAT